METWRVCERWSSIHEAWNGSMDRWMGGCLDGWFMIYVNKQNGEFWWMRIFFGLEVRFFLRYFPGRCFSCSVHFWVLLKHRHWLMWRSNKLSIYYVQGNYHPTLSKDTNTMTKMLYVSLCHGKKSINSLRVVKKDGFPAPVWVSCFLAFHFLAPRIGYLLDDLCGCQT